jgi:hypothetical protein
MQSRTAVGEQVSDLTGVMSDKTVDRHPVGPRNPWWVEALVIVGLWKVYDLINNLAPLRQGRAFAHARALLGFERHLRLAPELFLNRWLDVHHMIGLVAVDYYDSLHFVITFGIVAWLWWSYPQRYRPFRNALVGINVLGFLVFWIYPLAPPRMLTSSGFVDIALGNHSGHWTSTLLSAHANDYAAMPSLHIAWALWAAIAVRSVSRRRGVRIVAAAYPVLTAVVVIATANHFLLDVIAGVCTTVMAVAIVGRTGRQIDLGDGPAGGDEDEASRPSQPPVSRSASGSEGPSLTRPEPYS